MGLFDVMIERFEIVGRARVLAVLRQQSDASLVDVGFSPEMVRMGIKAWPWRAEDELAGLSASKGSVTIDRQPVINTNVTSVGQIEDIENANAANSRLETAA